ncbi:hypothetical protein AXX17_AT3G53200 [Arabidopsis thaliana]|uniref:Uncharacterized protein n=1 Tax=Arabidopsis thaliana TaxID=3702 RepID=A0A178V927_ARATH|nr:hypothetical protein AXX17_AT3G53200 [Arabidopsis thaliana]
MSRGSCCGLSCFEVAKPKRVEYMRTMSEQFDKIPRKLYTHEDLNLTMQSR